MTLGTQRNKIFNRVIAAVGAIDNVVNSQTL